MTTWRQTVLVGYAILALMMIIIGAQDSVALAGPQSEPSKNTLSLPSQPLPAAPTSSVKPPLPQPDASLEVPSLKLRSQPGYEQVTVTVTDSAGKYVTDLKEDDFRIFEDGQQRPLGFFRIDRSAPVSVGIIVDCSSSMVSKFAQARRAIKRMVDDLDPRDDIFLESFSVEAQLLQPFTLDHEKIIDHLDFLHALTQTSLYDAVYMGLYEMRRARHDKRALIVVTDGMDNRSVMKREQVIAAARARKVLIYTIGIGEEAVNPGDEFTEIFASDDNELDLTTLKTLSDETGARTFNLRRVGDGDQLSQDCAAISDELRQQYTLAYLSPDPGHLGYRSLRIEVPGHPDLSVRVRKGVAVIPH